MPAEEDATEASPLLPPPAVAEESHKRHSYLARLGAGASAAVASRYALVLLLGAFVGFGLTKGWEKLHRQEDGPLMVPPVWTLPPPSGLPRNRAYLVNGTTAAVATEDATCSDLGLSVLRDMNGTAADAAITSTLCIGLLNAFSAGIGGGGFAVVNVPGDAVTAVDFRETSPRASTKDMFSSAGRLAAQVGGLSIAVPGELRGLEQIHKLYGTLPWHDLVMPVAKLARGWEVSRELARRIRLFGPYFMPADPVWSAVYAPRGALLVEGEWVARPTYGKTLERIAKEGPGAFYEGDLAETLIDTIKSHGGVMTSEDLQEYKARTYPAIHHTWRNRTIYTTDAPSSGGVMLGLLNILEPYDMASLSEADRVHLFIEAMKFAFGARSEITDPAFAPNVTRFADFYDKAWADEARSRITNATHGPEYYGLQHDTPIDHGTTHLSVVDRWGGAVSITSTVNLIWGSHVMCPHTGVIFNDEQDDFSVPGAPDAFGLLPSPWNYPAPGKRALSSTAPAIVLSNDSLIALGGSGGSRIFPSVAQVLLNLEAGLDLSAAIEAERWHNQLSPALSTLEVGPAGVDRRLLAALEARGHEVGLFDINLGASEVQAVMVDRGTVWASSDSRKNGVPAAY